ncbi:MAG TPA: pyruvate kinase, partial [Thermoplasmata archaeon]|nr:pyruvate kinase [Thermoplasmata archaeon]
AGMIANLRRAERATGRPVRVEMDLGGPRLRTGSLESGPAVVKVRPPRDDFGRVVRPARVRWRPPGAPDRRPGPFEAELEAPAAWLARRRRGDRIRFRDARGATRSFRVTRSGPGGVDAELEKTAYLTNGLSLEVRRGRPAQADRAVLSGVPSRPGRVRLAPGSTLRLLAQSSPPRVRSARAGRRPGTSSIGVSIPSVLRQVRRGHRIWFDGGRIGGVVRSVGAGGVAVRIDRAPPGGAWLRGDQGINLPDTDLELPPLSETDRRDLAFVVRHADLVGYSFVQRASDVGVLRRELARLGRPTMGVVLKIETRRAFDALPEILLAALRSGPSAVMLARGDLAVEVGFERLAEVQEEMLWLCEAARLPAIWATQVLEGLAKSGLPTRAEVTDAAMGERAECVMLNKGPFLLDAVRALDGILRRMQAHQAKKVARLRHLEVAERFLERERRRRPIRR